MSHDHGNHGSGGEDNTDDSSHGSMGCAMSMIFHGGYKECIIFDWWNTKTLESFIGSAVAIFLLTVLYEGIKYWRERMYTEKAAAFRAASAVNLTKGPPLQSLREQMFNRAHALQSVLHMLQMIISYALMLIAMTYNAYLILAVILGAGAGYFFFGWVRQRSVEVEEHCH